LKHGQDGKKFFNLKNVQRSCHASFLKPPIGANEFPRQSLIIAPNF